MGKGMVWVKRRVIKKWINRYLNPLIEHLPKVTYWDHSIYINVTLINGERVPEGCTYEVEHNTKSAIRKQLLGMQSVLSEFKDRKIYVRQENEPNIGLNQHWERHPEQWRNNPKMKFYGIRMRFLVDKVNP
jgi:hypothetical protein